MRRTPSPAQPSGTRDKYTKIYCQDAVSRLSGPAADQERVGAGAGSALG